MSAPPDDQLDGERSHERELEHHHDHEDHDHEHEHEHEHEHDDPHEDHDQSVISASPDEPLDHHAHSHGGVHGHSHGRIPSGAVSVSLISSAVLALAAAIEITIALLSHSSALLADGVHNLADVTTTICLAAAFLLSRRPSSRRYPFGFHRVEDIAGVLVVALIVASALVAGATSVSHLLHPPHLVDPIFALAAALIGLVANEAVALYKLRVGRSLHSVALEADGYHSRVDGFASLAAAIGIGGAWAGFPLLDPLVGCLLTGVIVWAAWETATSVTSRLLDAADPAALKEITDVVSHVDGVISVGDVVARWTGRRLLIELLIDVDGASSLRDAHAVAEAVRHALYHQIEGVGEVLVHLDPAGDPEAHRETAHHRTPVRS